MRKGNEDIILNQGQSLLTSDATLNIESTNLKTDSFEDKLEKSKEIDFIYNDRELFKNKLSLNDNIANLKAIDSEDSEVIALLNDDKSIKNIIVDFNKLGVDSVVGSNAAKRIVIEIISKIKNQDFRETEVGNKIYREFVIFNSNLNIDRLKMNQCFSYDVEILNNFVGYLLIGTDLNISDLKSFCKNFNFLLNCSVQNLPIEIDKPNMDIEEIVEDANNEIDKFNDKAIKKIDDIEKQNYSPVKKIFGYLYKYPMVFRGSCALLFAGGSCLLGTSYFGIFNPISLLPSFTESMIKPERSIQPVSNSSNNPIAQAIAEYIRSLINKK